MFRPSHQAPPFANRQLPMKPFNQGRALPPQAPKQNGLQGLLSKFTSTPGTVSQGGSKITNTLSNVQQVLNVAQQATPLIKEYGPLIKDAPKYISMIKALNEINKEEEEEVSEEKETEIEGNNLPDDEYDISSETPKKSQPKLFI